MKEKQIEISNECPPIYTQLHAVLGAEWNEGIAIADAPKIHCKNNLLPQVIIHEIEHIKQQEKIGKELWWELYLTKPSFRLEQEVEAYRKEYKFFCGAIADRNARFEYLYTLAQQLSSEKYGKLCTGSEALALIQG